MTMSEKPNITLAVHAQTREDSKLAEVIDGY